MEGRNDWYALKSRFYENDEERLSEINRVRNEVVERLQIPSGSSVLDVLVGGGDFARAIAKSFNGSRVVAGEILASDLNEAKLRIERDRLKESIETLRMDVTCMPFSKDSFDHVVNFSGWEDFAAFSGEELIGKAFGEMVRVLRMNGILAVTFIPDIVKTTNDITLLL